MDLDPDDNKRIWIRLLKYNDLDPAGMGPDLKICGCKCGSKEKYYINLDQDGNKLIWIRLVKYMDLYPAGVWIQTSKYADANADLKRKCIWIWIQTAIN